MSIESLAAEISYRVPELARDCASNRADVIAGLIREEMKAGMPTVRYERFVSAPIIDGKVKDRKPETKLRLLYSFSAALITGAVMTIILAFGILLIKGIVSAIGPTGAEYLYARPWIPPLICVGFISALMFLAAWKAEGKQKR
jgi:hypothetical protein